MQSTLPDTYARELQYAVGLDPLALGDVLTGELPGINRDQNLSGLLSITGGALEVAQDTDFRGQPGVASAALRDIDFLAASLTRMGTSPGSVDGLVPTMRQLGNEAGTVPRGTVYTYALQNPVEQERTFTGTSEEHFFIQTVRKAGEIMLSQCNELFRLNPRSDSPEVIAATLASTADDMKFVVEGMVEVSRVVSPPFFTGTMRPFFDGIEIDGVTYAGAGGAQLPLVVIDRIMWGSESTSAPYKNYYDDNIRYQPQAVREDMSASETGAYETSLLGHLRDRQTEGEDVSIAVDQAREVMRQIKRFRMPHRKVAQDNFKLRPDKAVGSGQYTPSILDTLIELTDDAIAEVVDMQVPVKVTA